MKWAFLGSNAQEVERARSWSQALSEKGVANEMSALDWADGEDVFARLNGYDFARVGLEHQMTVLEKCPRLSSSVQTIGVADGLYRQGGEWWAGCEIFGGFCETFQALGEQLDFKTSAFIAGTNAWARAAIGGLFKCGFRKFALTAPEKPSERFVAEMRRRYFGLQLDVVPMEKIVLLSGRNGILVNTTSHDAENPLITELCYLNFLKRPGVVVDMVIGDSPLLKEARDAQITAVDARETFEHTDIGWMSALSRLGVI